MYQWHRGGQSRACDCLFSVTRRLGLIPLVLLLVALPETSLTQTLDAVPGELIVKTKGQSFSQGSRAFLGKMAANGMIVKTSFKRFQMHHLKIQKGENLETVIRELQQDPDVEFVEPNYILRKLDETPNAIQTLSEEQVLERIATSSTSGYTQSYAPTGVTDAWNIASPTASRKPIIAVLDTGVDYYHPVLTQAQGIWVNAKEIPGNLKDDDGNGYVDDVHGWNFFHNNNSPLDDDGHGTHVAGIVVGLSTDIFKKPVSEASVQVMPLKFLGADGSGDTASAVRAVDYAIAQGARVINASWGGSSYSRSLHEALTRAYGQGVLVVAAAGNFGTNNDDSPIYPANLDIPGLISVAASTNYDTLASFSNFGVRSVDFAAPGLGVASTFPGGMFGLSHGTSMAAPFVAGVAGLMLREAADLSGFQLRELMLSSLDSSASFSGKLYASGRLNVLKSLMAAQRMAGATSIVPAYAASVPSRVPASEGGDSSGSGGGGGCGTIATLKGLTGSNGNGPAGGPRAVGVLILFLLPLALWLFLRRQHHQGKASIAEFDLRFAQRVDVSDVIAVKTRRGHVFQATLKNISKGGLAFSFKGAPVSIDESVTFVFTSRDGSERIEVEGCIVWHKDQTVAGVQFKSLNSYMQQFFLETYALPSA